MTAWLYHYGVSKLDGAPGRGSGRYPLGSGKDPYQNRTVLKKGTRINTVSIAPNEELFRRYIANKPIYTYRPDVEWDSRVYKGPFSYYKKSTYPSFNFDLYEFGFEVVRDLKMPTSKERVDEFVNLYTNNKRMTVKDLANMQKFAKSRNVLSDSAAKVNVKKLQSEEDYNAAYEIFNHTMENVKKYASAGKYLDLMATKYDAMVDDNNRSIYNRVHDPIVVFKANEVLKQIGDVKVITNQEIQDNLRYIADELTKIGEVPKL